MTILACGAAFVGMIAILVIAIGGSSKAHEEQDAEDREQMEALCEWQAMHALERDLFDKPAA